MQERSLRLIATRTVFTEACFILSFPCPVLSFVDGYEVIADEFLEEATYDVRRHWMLRLLNILA